MILIQCAHYFVFGIVEGCIETNEARTELPWEQYIAWLYIPRYN